MGQEKNMQNDIARRSLKVLVIEDDTLTRLSLCRLLQNMDFCTVEACNGYMGLRQYQRERPDLVITDIFMPDKEGLATILEIRALDPDARIVAMSGGCAKKDVDPLQMAEDMGAILTLKKPFNRTDVGAVMAALQAPVA
jgi:DNA-binding NtrC family response regulator